MKWNPVHMHLIPYTEKVRAPPLFSAEFAHLLGDAANKQTTIVHTHADA